MKGTRGGRPEARLAPGSQGAAKRQQQARQARPPRPRGSSGEDTGSGKGRPTPAAAASTGAASPAVPPLAFQLTTLLLSLAGLGVSIWLTITHYSTSVTLSCPNTGAINCQKVTTSPESMVFGIFPVAVLGLAFYVFMVAINSPWAWRSRLPGVRWLRLAAAIAGIGFVIYLISVELFAVDAICLWCTSVHVVTFLLFCLIVAAAAIWGMSARPGQQAPR